MSDFLASIQAQPAQRYQPYGPGGVHTLEEARIFIDTVGFCLFGSNPGIELPCFGPALGEDVREELWGWKDSLATSREVFYGPIYHPGKGRDARPGFASLRMLMPLYALAPLLQFGGDRALLRRFTRISQEAVTITETLEREGSLSTGELRAATEMTGKTNAARFSRGLSEAQAHFMVAIIGVTSTTRANYGYIWNTFERVFPAVIQAAEGLREPEAAEAIIRQYVRTAQAVPAARIAAMLHLDEKLIQSAAKKLVEDGVLKEVEGSLKMAG